METQYYDILLLRSVSLFPQPVHSRNERLAFTPASGRCRLSARCRFKCSSWILIGCRCFKRFESASNTLVSVVVVVVWLFCYIYIFSFSLYILNLYRPLMWTERTLCFSELWFHSCFYIVLYAFQTVWSRSLVLVHVLKGFLPFFFMLSLFLCFWWVKLTVKCTWECLNTSLSRPDISCFVLLGRRGDFLPK